MARGKYKGPKRGSGQRGRDRSAEEEEEDAFRQGASQARNAGKMPPSDSEEDAEDGNETVKKQLNMFSAMGAPGDLPPNSSDEDDEDDDSDDEVAPPGVPAAPVRKRKDDEPDPDQIAKDMERLQLIKQKREEQRLERIAREGWDRFAPVTETNKPPDMRPSDHPDRRKESETQP